MSLPPSSTTPDDEVLVPDYQDDPADFLVSFADIKRKTTQTLYSSYLENDANSTSASKAPWAVDKSPKGCVDEPIRPLVDLINHHPSFSTLSSCSGRIALFRPWENKGSTVLQQQQSTTTMEEDSTTITPTPENGTNTSNTEQKPKGTPGSGKGSGGWILVSHEVIDHKELLELFDDDNDSDDDDPQEETNKEEETVMMFKVEPMLLHVATATLDRGRQLLALALDMGFRESGLVLPSKRHANNRVTVAIRGVSLALVVPLTFAGPLRPSQAYLRALVDQANHRLTANGSKLLRLTASIKEALFRPPAITATLGSMQEFQYDYCQSLLPDLNLWGHDAVVLRSCESNSAGDNENHNDDIDVLAFGGYGQGPSLAEKDGATRLCRRMGEVFCLKRRKGQWDPHWERISGHTPLSEFPQEPKMRLESLGVDVRPIDFTPREGVACFSLDSRIAVIWGGRKGPKHPLSDLLLYEHSPTQQQARFVTPVDVRGDIPAPRWGHSLSPLALPKPTQRSNSTIRRLAVLVGGRNERVSLDSVHMLSLVRADSPGGPGHFLWETVTFPSFLDKLSFPFHHATVAVPFDDKMAVFVFGGHSDPCNLLEDFSADPTDEENSGSHTVTSFTLSLDSKRACEAGECCLSLPPDVEEDLRVGRAITCLERSANASGNNVTFREPFICFSSGGVPSSSAHHDHHPSIHPNRSCLQAFELCRRSKDGDIESEWHVQSLNLICAAPDSNQDSINESVMVHHRALDVSSRGSNQSEVLLLGGGVMGFAFGPCFSR